MRKSLYTLLWITVSWLAASVAYAEGDGAREDTLVVVEEGASPDDIMNVIDLPFSAAPQAGDHSPAGRSNAHDAKSYGKEFGQQMADEAKSKNVGQSIRDEMQQSRRQDARDRSDGRRPENPGRP